MQAYMKSAMPYLGVSTVPRRAVRPIHACEHCLQRRAAWEADVLALWRVTKFRVLRYAAV